MLENKNEISDQVIIEKEFKKVLNVLYSLIFGLSFFTIAVFFIPIGFLSRTARRMGEYSTLFDLHGGVAVLIVVILWLVVVFWFFSQSQFIDLLRDKIIKVKIIEKINITEIQELTEVEKRQWKILKNNYTHKVYVDFGDKMYFDVEKNPELLFAKCKVIEYSKYSQIVLKEILI